MICRSPRNKLDDHIRAIVQTGGLIGAVMCSPAVRHDERPTLEDYLNHVDDMINVGGIDHVAFASGVTEGQASNPEKWTNPMARTATAPTSPASLAPCTCSRRGSTFILSHWHTHPHLGRHEKARLFRDQHRQGTRRQLAPRYERCLG